MQNKKIAILSGDGIGAEVMTQTLRVLEALKLPIAYEFGLIGGAAFDEFSEHFPDQTKELCLKSDAVLFGSVGGPVNESSKPKWHKCEANSILALRKTLSLSVNLRPSQLFPSLEDISPLNASRIENGVDIMIVRELLGDIYFGEHKRYEVDGLRQAHDIAHYDENQIKAALHQGFKTASSREKRLVSVDKANVLDTSRLWRELAQEVAQDYPEVELQHMLVDNCAMQLILNPAQFDTIVTSNLFGDILSDAASALPGSLGLMPSASFSSSGFGLYEPSGGSAPEIAGQNIANPIAQILSLGLLLKYSLPYQLESEKIENAVKTVLSNNYRTNDIAAVNSKILGTKEFTDKIIENL